MRKIYIFFVMIFLVINMPYIGDSRHQILSDDLELSNILQKAGDYCERLTQIALYFVCMEDVKEKIYHPFKSKGKSTGGIVRTEFNRDVYDYQLIRKGEKIEETRSLEKGDNKSLKMDAGLRKTSRFYYSYVIFGPTGLLSYSAQKNHEYSIIKEAKLWGRPIIIVEVVPKNLSESDRLYGKAWIDKELGSILKIEWEGTSLGNYAGLLEVAKKLNAAPSLRFYSEYRFEKNEIRFPSQFKISEEYILEKLFREIQKSELKVEYKDYKFFIVETEVKHGQEL